jgi:hypothetical protein
MTNNLTASMTNNPPARYHPTASMTNNPPAGSYLDNPWVLSCKQQIIALSKVCTVNNTNVLEQKIVVFSLVATAHLQS